MKLSFGLSLTAGGPSGPSYGPELVSNGDFPTATTGWVATGDAVLSVAAGQLRVTTPGGGPNGGQQDVFGLEIGETYRFQATMVPHEGDRARIILTSATTQNLYFAVVGGAVDIEFVAATTGLAVVLSAASAGAWASAGEYASFDNISLKKVL